MTGIANAVVDFARDCKRIAAQPAHAQRSDLWRSYLGLRLGRRQRSVPGETRVMGYRVAYLDHANLLHLFREIFVSRAYDMRLDARAPRIIDCGSNIGMAILFFKQRYPDAEITGFEPHPEVHATLARNVERNGLRGVTLHRKAVDRECGERRFFASADGPGALNMGFFGADEQAASMTVDTVKLSAYVEREVDLLKLDIEGAEERVLAELAASGRLRAIRNIACEYHHHLDPSADRLATTLGILENAGFGYRIAAYCADPSARSDYQDVIIYAYRKQ